MKLPTHVALPSASLVAFIKWAVCGVVTLAVAAGLWAGHVTSDITSIKDNVAILMKDRISRTADNPQPPSTTARNP